MVREFTAVQHSLIVTRKLLGATLTIIRLEYEARWLRNIWHVLNDPPPDTKLTLRRLVVKFNVHGTVQDRKMRLPSGRDVATYCGERRCVG